MSRTQSEGTEETEQESEVARSKPSHAAEDGAPRHPLIDLSRDPNPGVPDHAASDEE